MEITSISFDDFEITSDRSKMDIESIHNYLSNHADWCKNIPYPTVKKSIEHSLCFGLFYQKRQIGFARVISDFATIAYLGDVYVLSEFRGLGLSTKLMNQVMLHPNLQGLRRWILVTTTAPWLYEKFNFESLNNPSAYMERVDLNVYES